MTPLYGPGPGEPPTLIASTDLAGLSASDVEDRPVGELFGTLSEAESGLIRYLDVAMANSARHVLVPIGHVRVERELVPPRVRLRVATYEDLMSVPEYAPGASTVDAGYQAEVIQAHGRLFYGSRYYAHPAYDHQGLDAGEAPMLGPAGGVLKPASAGPRLRPLAELPDHRLARAESDVRGWPVVDRREESVGEIRELLIEWAAGQARYVIISLDEPKRSTALPVGYLQVERDAARVRAPGLTREEIGLLPAYEGSLRRVDENRIQAALEANLTGERFFHRADFRPW